MSANTYNPWRDAVLDALAVYGVDQPISATPAAIVQHIIDCAVDQALDPLISARARALQMQVQAAEPDPEPGQLCARCAALEFDRVSGFGDLTP